jgi:hypothetical protein
MVTWVAPWRHRLVDRESKQEEDKRRLLRQSIFNLEKKKMRLCTRIQRWQMK